MATIKLNGLTDFKGITTFSYAPTVLDISSSASGTYTTHEIQFNEWTDLDADIDHTIVVNNVTLVSTEYRNQAMGYRFYLSKPYSSSEWKYCCNSLLRVLMNVPVVASSYDAYIPTDESGEKQTKIILRSKQKGNNTPLTITTNIPFITITTTEGTTATELKNGQLNVDIFKEEEYITTMSKSISNDTSVKFELGSIFTTKTDDGKAENFGMSVYLTSDDGLIELGNYSDIWNVNGYLVNGGATYLPKVDKLALAQNVSNGDPNEYTNNTILYVFGSSIPISVYTQDEQTSVSYTVSYIASDMSVLTNRTYSKSTLNHLNHFTVNLLQSQMNRAKYVDIKFLDGDLGTLHYEIIKPLKTTNEETRIYWYNSYGGISFFDFTGGRTEVRKITNTTYNKSILDYYSSNVDEQSIVYDKKNETTVTLKTHNIRKDAQWVLFDLQNARVCWIVENGTQYRVITDNLTITETNVNDIYTASIEFKYSLRDNIS